MNIGIFHYKVGGTDGVSLEIDKWRRVLEEMGHTVHLCAGDVGATDGTLIPEMYHHRAEAERLAHNTFVNLQDYPDDAAYRADLLRQADAIEQKLRAFIAQKQIDFLIPQNVWSVAAHPAVAIALTRTMRVLRLPALAQHHDFFWERNQVSLTCRTAIELAAKYLPPHDALARHVVINSLAQQELSRRTGLEATVVPNIFDFEAPPWQPDAYNRDLRQRIGLRDNDVFVLQATRVVARKGIELAVDFVQALNAPRRRARLSAAGLYNGRPFTADSRIVLVLAGYTQDDLVGYTNKLRRKIARAGIEALFIEDVVAGERSERSERQTPAGQKVYSLWDTYVFADFVTYPSLWEGWGNQFLEAVRAKLPLMLFEYPVFRADIKDKGFNVVSLGGDVAGYDAEGLARVTPARMEAAADRAIELLTDGHLRAQAVDHNFELARQHYSMPALREYLSRLLGH